MDNKNYVYKILFLFCLILLQLSNNIYAKKLYVGKVVFTGNNTFSDNALLQNMELRPSTLFSRTLFSHFKIGSDRNVLENFYRSEGFLNPSVNIEVVHEKRKKRIDLRISINEGKRVFIRSVGITPNPATGDSMGKYLQTKAGNPLRYTVINSDASKLAEMAAGKGFLKVKTIQEITIDSVEYKADVLFRVKTGPRIRVGKIDIRGLRSVKQFVVERELKFKSGDTLTSELVNRSERNLYMTRLFNFAQVKPTVGDSADTLAAFDTVTPVTVTLDQARYFTFEAGGGYGSYERITLETTASYANLFARGHTLTFDGGVSSIDQKARLIYSTPWVYTLPLQFSAGAYYERHDNLFFTVPLGFTGAFDGVTVSLGRTTERAFAYQVQFLLENVLRISAPSLDSIPSGVPDKNTQSILAYAAVDRRNDVFNPFKGYFSQISIELAGLGGARTNQFFKFVYDLRGYADVNKKLLFSSAVTLGWAKQYGSSSVVPAQDQFYGGGPRSVRGYKFNQLITTPEGQPEGGNVEIILHIIDFQFPLIWWINGAVFSDAGFIWNKLSAVNLRDLRYTAGPCLRIVTPVGLVRMDVGFRINNRGRNNTVFNFDVGRPF